MSLQPVRMGLWSYAHVHAPTYAGLLCDLPGVTFAGIADDDPARGQAAASRHGVPYFDDPAHMLRHIDGVVLCSPNVEHAAMAVRAAHAKVHVLSEKPLATTVADGEAMMAACQQAGVILATAFPCPFSPAFEQLSRDLHAGAIGEILAFSTTNRGTMPGGWFIDVALSGGAAVIDHTVHVADALRRLVGPVRQVYAAIGHNLYGQSWDDSGLLSFQFDNGVFASLDCSWSRPPSFPTWGDVTITGVGTGGTISVDMFNQHLSVYPSQARAMGKWQGWGDNLDRAMLLDFVNAIRNSTPPRSTGADGLAALKVALAAYRSAQSGQPVEVG